DVGRVFPLACFPVVRDVVHVARELECAAARTLEVPEVVRAEDMAARTRVGLPAPLSQSAPAHHDFIEITKMELDVVQPARNFRLLNQEQVMMICRSIGAQKA